MDETYYNTIKTWRKEYEEKLGAPDGWLSISGLFWLKEGENRIGTAKYCDVTLPFGSGPAQVGSIKLSGHQITLQSSGGVQMVCNGQPVTTLDVKINDYGSSDWIFLDGLKFAVIERGGRYGVRIYDPKNPARRKYYNVRWFPIDEALCIQARYHPLDQPLMLSIINVLGDLSEEPCPGYVEFTLADQVCKLYPVLIDDGERLWFIFKDASNGKLTYHGGRFLTANAPQEGIVTLDFNKAYNPPCSYTMFATCPLPPENNKMVLQVHAGEMNFFG
jgi:uncharacterized protein (DUF1684 family)